MKDSCEISGDAGKTKQSSFLLDSDSFGAVQRSFVPEKHATLRWKIATFMLALLSCALVAIINVQGRGLNRQACQTPKKTTDFVSARDAIEYEQVEFIGAPLFQANGKLVVPHEDKIYVGNPRPEQDEAWRNLTFSTYIRITEDEAEATWGDAHFDYWNDNRGGYVAGLEVFHTLHCLNRLRMLLFPEYYQFKGYDQFNDNNHAVHRDHCIQQIRQYIMCGGDMTPLPTRYSTATGRNYVFSDTLHTCRNFDKLKTWADSRHHGEIEVLPYNRKPAR